MSQYHVATCPTIAYLQKGVNAMEQCSTIRPWSQYIEMSLMREATSGMTITCAFVQHSQLRVIGIQK
jgi:hypothetical protein